MTKKLLLFFALFLTVYLVQAQNGFVGIGTTDPKAKLQITSTNSGIIIPKYATLTAIRAIPGLNSTDHKGMMVFVEETANQGFWYYDGAAFVKVASGVVPISSGGTGKTNANDARNALLPPQAGNAGRALLADQNGFISWGNPLKMALISDVKPYYENSSPSVVKGWSTRDLNTMELTNNFVTLARNEFTLPAGRYKIEASAPAYSVGGHRIRIWNVSENVPAIYGQSAATYGSSQTNAFLSGYIYVDGSNVFRLEHYTEQYNEVGFGVPLFGFTDPTVYSIVEITKLD